MLYDPNSVQTPNIVTQLREMDCELVSIKESLIPVRLLVN
ncbi:hypothetical protein ENHY17A_140004 [Moraxellaceae bacterium 17A]|nr:hypothetical protein ENHY17A_140004 [Moraxellaceae bacterium 17A]